VENVAAEPSSWCALLQNILCPIFKFVADGFHTNRATLTHIESAKFKDVVHERCQGSSLLARLNPVGTLLLGKATK